MSDKIILDLGGNLVTSSNNGNFVLSSTPSSQVISTRVTCTTAGITPGTNMLIQPGICGPETDFWVCDPTTGTDGGATPSIATFPCCQCFIEYANFDCNRTILLTGNNEYDMSLYNPDWSGPWGWVTHRELLAIGDGGYSAGYYDETNQWFYGPCCYWARACYGGHKVDGTIESIDSYEDTGYAGQIKYNFYSCTSVNGTGDGLDIPQLAPDPDNDHWYSYGGETHAVNDPYLFFQLELTNDTLYLNVVDSNYQNLPYNHNPGFGLAGGGFLVFSGKLENVTCRGTYTLTNLLTESMIGQPLDIFNETNWGGRYCSTAYGGTATITFHGCPPYDSPGSYST